MNIKIKYSEIAPTLNDSDSISIYKQIGKILDIAYPLISLTL